MICKLLNRRGAGRSVRRVDNSRGAGVVRVDFCVADELSCDGIVLALRIVTFGVSLGVSRNRNTDIIRYGYRRCACKEEIGISICFQSE